MARVLIITSLILGPLLSACVTTEGQSVMGLDVLEPLAYDTVAVFQSPNGEGAVRKLKLKAEYDLQISPGYYGIPLKDLNRIDGVLVDESPDETAVIVKGGSAGCNVDYRVYVIQLEAMETYRLGNCKDPLEFTRLREGFYAKQGVGQTASVWSYGPSQGVSGPVLVADLQPATESQVTNLPPPVVKNPEPASAKRPKPTPSVAKPNLPAPKLEDMKMPPVVAPQAEQVDVTKWKIRTKPQS